MTERDNPPSFWNGFNEHVGKFQCKGGEIYVLPEMNRCPRCGRFAKYLGWFGKYWSSTQPLLECKKHGVLRIL